MLCTDKAKLDELLLALLTKRPLQTVEELSAELARQPRHYKTSSVYQELRKLVALGVVSRFGRRYSLRMGWVLNLIETAESMYRSHVAPESLLPLLPQPGTSRRWTFTSLPKLVQFWTNLLLLLLEQDEAHGLIEEVPHAWFHIVDEKTEQQFLRALLATGSSYHLLVHGETAIDKSYSQIWNRAFGEISFGHSVISRDERSYWSVAGPYLIHVRLNASFANRIRTSFEAAGKGANASSIMLPFLLEPTHIALKIENNRSKADQHYRAFDRFFGLPAASLSKRSRSRPDRLTGR